VVRWSKDRQALAVIGIRSEDPSSFVLLAWRNGEEVRDIGAIRPFDYWEVAHDAIWSPDKRRVLLMGPESMGEGDAGEADIWCFRLRDGRLRYITRDAARAQWLDGSRIRYWEATAVEEWFSPSSGQVCFRNPPPGWTKSWAAGPETPHEWDCRAPDPSVPEEFQHNLKQREAVVGLARAGKLASIDLSVTPDIQVLPAPYRHLSEDGQVQVLQDSGNTTVVFFRRVNGGAEDRFYYEANGQPPEGLWVTMKKVAPHWFWASP
jgi:hypothetical protein